MYALLLGFLDGENGVYSNMKGGCEKLFFIPYSCSKSVIIMKLVLVYFSPKNDCKIGYIHICLS